MIPRSIVPTALAALVLAAPLAAQRIVLLPAGSWANDVTPDGSVVVGTYPGGGFIWRWRQDPAPTIVLGGDMVGVSDDGTVVVGTIKDPITLKQVAARWTQATGWQGLGGLPGGSCDAFTSTGYAISGDGTTVVGLSWLGCNARGFRWTAATGMQELQKLANGNNRCSAISRDGSTLGGFAQGNFERTPAYWAPNLSGAVLDPNFLGEVFGFNNDGSRSVGTLIFPGQPNYDAFVRNSATGALTNIGHLNSGWAGDAEDITEDGTMVVGFDVNGLARQAWVWTSSDGIKSLNDRLSALGVTGAPPLLVCRAVSDDGNVIVGGAQGPGSFDGLGFIVELSSVEPFGTGTPGCTGLPVLTANAAPHVNTPGFRLSSTKASPLSTGLWMVADAPDTLGSDPFAIGAVLYVDLFAATELITLNGTSDATGLGTAAAPIPNSSFLIGKTYYAQVLWAWPLSVCNNLPYGLSTSNGLSITVVP